MIAETRRRTVAVVLAGGVGQRMGLATPKQLLKIAGKTILEHTLGVFDGHPEIDEVVLLMAPGFVDEAAALVRRNGYAKVGKVLAGGASRTETTWRALSALGGPDGPGEADCDVLLHDAVRPLVEPGIISACVAALARHEAVEVAIPSSDTILVTAPEAGGEVIREVPDRSRLRRAQTPQCFRLSVIRAAYRLALADPGFEKLPPTDDCGVVLRYLPDVPIYLVPGSEHNMKVTHPVDVVLAETLVRLAGGVPPAPAEEALRAALCGKTLVVFGAGGSAIGDLGKTCGATVRVLSRSRDGVRVEHADAVRDALARAHAETGRIDYVVDASAALHTGALAAADQRAVEQTIAINHLGPVNVARASLVYLTETRGHLLFCPPAPHAGALTASTRAVTAELTRSLAIEWSGSGVRVNCLPAGPDAVRVALAVLISDVTGHVFDSAAGESLA